MRGDGIWSTEQWIDSEIVGVGQGRWTLAKKCLDSGKEVVRVLSGLFVPTSKVIY